MDTPKGLSTQFLDQVNPDKNCPGFHLWDVLASDGKRYLMAGDHVGGVETRLFFRSIDNGIRLTIVEITDLGDNPSVAEWERLRAERAAARKARLNTEAPH